MGACTPTSSRAPARTRCCSRRERSPTESGDRAVGCDRAHATTRTRRSCAWRCAPRAGPVPRAAVLRALRLALPRRRGGRGACAPEPRDAAARGCVERRGRPGRLRPVSTRRHRLRALRARLRLRRSGRRDARVRRRSAAAREPRRAKARRSRRARAGPRRARRRPRCSRRTTSSSRPGAWTKKLAARAGLELPLEFPREQDVVFETAPARRRPCTRSRRRSTASTCVLRRRRPLPRRPRLSEGLRARRSASATTRRSTTRSRQDVRARVQATAAGAERHAAASAARSASTR